MPIDNSEKLIVALDVATKKEAKALIETLSPVVSVFKVGKELFTSFGPEILELLHKHNKKIFLDLKFHDIPNTVAAACKMATKHEVFMMNVHAIGGKNMMIHAVQSVQQTAQKLKIAPPLVLAVTVLTSMTDRDLKEVGVVNELKTQVTSLTCLAKESGLDGVVASAQEIELIREAVGDDFCIVTPGVRPTWAASDDQKRITTPREAIELGANFIVVGRPIIQDPNPLEAAKKILKEIG